MKEFGFMEKEHEDFPPIVHVETKGASTVPIMTSMRQFQTTALNICLWSFGRLSWMKSRSSMVH